MDLDKGWLNRQFAQVKKETDAWPENMKAVARFTTNDQKAKPLTVNSPVRSIEQAVRDILTAAIEDGLVRACDDSYLPENMTAGDLVFPANVLSLYLEEINDNK